MKIYTQVLSCRSNKMVVIKSEFFLKIMRIMRTLLNLPDKVKKTALELFEKKIIEFRKLKF